MKTAPTTTLTIGRLAKQAGVGIETIRYYQQRDLLPLPESTGSYRQYPVAMIERIRFIKRAQELGFSLDEIRELLTLDDHSDKLMIRQIAEQKIMQIQQKLDDLLRMKSSLQTLVTCCSQSSEAERCPIIDSLSGIPTPH